MEKRLNFILDYDQENSKQYIYASLFSFIITLIYQSKNTDQSVSSKFANLFDLAPDNVNLGCFVIG